MSQALKNLTGEWIRDDFAHFLCQLKQTLLLIKKIELGQLQNHITMVCEYRS